MQPESLLTDQDVSTFHNNGVLVVRGFYDRDEIEPIQRNIYDIIGLIIRKHDLDIDRPSFEPLTFDSGFQPLIAHNRSYGAEVYDAVKQIPAFIRLSASEKHDRVFRQLRPDSIPGFAAGGSGIRIDNPNEHKFRANWHQDYPTQLRSPDGLVFWSTLVPITPDLGPVEFALGSHHDGACPIYTRDPRTPEKEGAYAITLNNEEAVLARYEKVAPATTPGDLVVIDYLTLHASGANYGNRSRWSMQMRYFNFKHPLGVKTAWAGTSPDIKQLREIHPELVLD
jgi:hypothetical protein